MTERELWQAVLGDLELNLSKANFTTWFKQTNLLSFENGKVLVGVPNTITKSWLESKYNSSILKTLENLSGIIIKEIIFKVVPNQGHLYQSTQSSKVETFSPPPSSSSSCAGETEKETRFPSYTPSSFCGLNPKYIFENFIVGKHNELAKAAAESISEAPGQRYNPLFVYGGAGLGKTHLIQAVGHAILSKFPQKKVLYTTFEKFTSDFISAVRTGQAKKFKETYRNVDVLLIDDIQFIIGKIETQEEFFHTFNSLHQEDKQIVITSDRPPKCLPTIQERLISRFEWGVIADINPPDFETKIAILESKCNEKGVVVDRQVLSLVASRVHSNIRELEGVLNKLIAYSQLKNVPISLNLCESVVQSLNPVYKTKNLTTSAIINTVSQYFGLRSEEILSKNREQRLVVPRQIIMYLMREDLNNSFPTIGKELKRDHTTVIHAYSKITEAIENNSKIQQDLNLLRQRLYNA